MITVAPDQTPVAGPRHRPARPRPSRAPGTVRANRLILTLLGLILLLAGVAGLLAGLGVFGSTLEQEAVLSARVDRFVERHGWFWPALAAVAAVVALLALWWLLIQLRTNRLREVDLRPEAQDGNTRMPTNALRDALEEEIESYRGVIRARTRFTGSPVAPRLTLRVAIDGRVPAREIVRRLDTEALAHARTALGTPTLPTELELVLPRTTRRDVR
jgi:hypothetical protein